MNKKKHSSQGEQASWTGILGERLGLCGLGIATANLYVYSVSEIILEELGWSLTAAGLRRTASKSLSFGDGQQAQFITI